MSNSSQNLMSNGLGTLSTTVPNANNYLVRAKISLPQLSQGSSDSSAVVSVLKKNGSTVLTGAAGAEGLEASVTCAAGDTLALQTSSAASVDQPLNAIKVTLSISEGF